MHVTKACVGDRLQADLFFKREESNTILDWKYLHALFFILYIFKRVPSSDVSQKLRIEKFTALISTKSWEVIIFQC